MTRLVDLYAHFSRMSKLLIKVSHYKKIILLIDLFSGGRQNLESQNSGMQTSSLRLHESSCQKLSATLRATLQGNSIYFL